MIRALPRYGAGLTFMLQPSQKSPLLVAVTYDPKISFNQRFPVIFQGTILLQVKKPDTFSK